jgi:hypothetical protein
MAKRPPPQLESKQGLVVTLVFFILATIGAGLAAYYGFADKDKLKADVKKATDEKKGVEEEARWLRFEIALMRAYLGAPAPVEEPKEPKPGEEKPKPGELRIGQELPGSKKDFDAGTLGPKYDDYASVKSLIAKLAARSKWDPNKNLPEKSYEQLLKEFDAKVAELIGEVRVAVDEKNLALKQRTDAEAAKKKAQDDYANDIAELKKKFGDARVAYEGQIKELTDQLKASGDKSEPLVKELQGKLDVANKEKATLEKKIKEYEQHVAVLQQKVDTSPAATADKESQLEARGEIVRVHTNLKRATINFGRNDGLKPGITFTVHGKQSDGKPKRSKKADVQVLNVEARTAEVEISNVVVYDPERRVYETIDVLSPDNKDPVVKGDVLINPLWNPNAKTHVALAGYFDFVGTTPNQVNSFIRRLEDQNVVVDAYVDLSNGQIKGTGVTRRTEYILRGGELDGREPGAPRDKEGVKTVNENIRKLLDEAKQNGVEVMRAERFLRDTGFALPRRAVIDD